LASDGGGNIRSEETSQEVADDTTDTVLSEHIEALINAKDKLELGAKVASDGADNTEDNSSPRGNVTSARGDGNETGNDTGAEADSAPLALKAVVEKAPGEASNAGGDVGDDAGHDSAEVRGKSGTTVEAEPANPEENGSENDVGDVVGTVGETVNLAVAGALSEHQGVGESGGTGADVDWGTTGEIETAHDERPAIGVPGPVRNRVIDDGGPDEDEDDCGEDASAVSSATNGESGAGGNCQLMVP
jgi:hypothetical protein